MGGYCFVSSCRMKVAVVRTLSENSSFWATLQLVNNVPLELTPKQGQYLAFIYYYTKITGQAPAEADFQRYFRVSPPSVHNMIVTLDERRFISREPGRGRSIKLLLDREAIPDLE